MPDDRESMRSTAALQFATQPKKKIEGANVPQPFGGARIPQPRGGYHPASKIQADAETNKNQLLKIKPSVTPGAETMPELSGPPAPALTMENVWLPMVAVNKKVAQITKAHNQVTGVDPSPGLVRDMLIADPVISKAAVSYRDMFARSNMPLDSFRGMQQKNLMQQARYLGEHGFEHDVGFPGVEEKDWHVRGLINTSAPQGSYQYQQVEAYNRYQVAQSQVTKEGFAGWLGGTLDAINPIGHFIDFASDPFGTVAHFGALAADQVGVGLPGGSVLGLDAAGVVSGVGAVHKGFNLAGATGELKVAGLIATKTPAQAYLGRPYRDAMRFQSQIMQSMEQTPQGVIYTIDAVGHDLWDATAVISPKPGQSRMSTLVPHRSGALIEKTFEQMREDVAHPERNIGYLALDVFAAASLGAGAAARVGAFSRVVSETRAAAAAGDIRPVAVGETRLYRPAEAETIIDEGILRGHAYTPSVETARRLAGEGQVVSVDLPSTQVAAYAHMPGLDDHIVLPTTVDIKPLPVPGRAEVAKSIVIPSAKALAYKPVGGSGVFGFADTATVVPFMDNQLIKMVQKGFYKLQTRRLIMRQLNGTDIGGNLTLLDHVFAPEPKLRKLLDQQRETEMGLQLAPIQELQRLQRFDSVGKQILQDVFGEKRKVFNLLSLREKELIGTEMAIRLLGWDSPDSINLAINHHLTQIASHEQKVSDLLEVGAEGSKMTAAQFKGDLDYEKYLIGSQKAQLEAIDAAMEQFKNPSARFLKTYEQGLRVVKKMTQTQRELFGMSDQTFDQSIAEVRYQLLGQKPFYEPGVGKFVYPRGSELWAEAKATVNEREAVANDLERQIEELHAKRGRQLYPVFQKKLDRLNTQFDHANLELEDAQNALNEMGAEPEKIPLTRVVIGKNEPVEKAVRELNKALVSDQNPGIQQAIAFLEQGEYPPNVAAYLDQLVNHYLIHDGEGTPDPPKGTTRLYRGEGEGHLTHEEQGLIPGDETHYFSDDYDFAAGHDTGGGVWYVDVPNKIAKEHMGDTGVELPGTIAAEATPYQLGLSSPGYDALLHIEEAIHQLGGAPAANILFNEPREVSTPEGRLREHYRRLEDIVLTAEAKGQDIEDLSVYDDWLKVNEQLGLDPHARGAAIPEDPRAARAYHVEAGARMVKSEKEALFHLNDAQANLEDIAKSKENEWGGLPIDEAKHYEELRVSEAQAFLAGKPDLAQRARGEQIAIDQRWFEGDEKLPPPSMISHEDLTTAARNALIDPRVAAAQEVLNKMREPVGSIHIPQRREVHREKDTRVKRLFQRMTPTGFRPPQSPDSHRHRTGVAWEQGDLRFDTSQTLIEQYGDVARIAEALVHHRQMFASHSEGGPAVDLLETPNFRLTPSHQPIRDLRDAPPALKELAAALQRLEAVPKKDRAKLHEQMDKLATFLYPDEAEAKAIAAAGGHVRYIDESFLTQNILGFDPKQWRNFDVTFGKLMGPINEMWRFNLLYASPAYALNALGSTMLLLTRQGFLAPVNYGRALASRHIYGGEVTRMLDTLAGNTHTMSYLPDTENRNLFTAMSQSVANVWQHLTDTHFRRAAVIYELRRRGLLRDSMTPEELADQLTSSDPKIKRDVWESAHASRKSMLDFNQQTWPEKAIARHLFFIYSFFRASAAYSLHYLFEHPAQHAALSAAGRDREDMIKKLIGDHMPKWFYDQGWIPIGPGEAINPNQMNMAGVLNQLSNPIHSLFSYTPYGDASGMLGGGATAFIDAFQQTSSQSSARQHHGAFVGTLLDMVGKTPAGQIWNRKGQEGKRQTPLPMFINAAATDPARAALASERDAVNMPVFEVHGFWDTYGRFLMRSGKPIYPNKAALQAREWKRLRNDDPAAYARHELEMVQDMVTAQSHVLNRDAPPEVRAAVTLVAQYVQHMNDWKEGKLPGMVPPKDPNDLMKAVETVKYLHKEGMMNDRDFRTRMATLHTPLSQGEQRQVALGALWNSGGRDWKNWNDQVQAVDFFNKPDYSVTVQRLDKDSIGDFSDSVHATRGEKWQYGREALLYSAKRSQLMSTAHSLRGDERIAALDQLKAFDDSHAQPVTIGEHTFPPLTLAADPSSSYGRMTETERQRWLITRGTRNWGSLSGVERQILTGQPVDPEAAFFWRTLNEWLAKGRAELPPGKRLFSGAKKYYGDTLATRSKPFAQQWAVAHQSLAQRMLTYSSIKNSAYSSEWNSLLSGVSSFATAAYAKGWKPAALADQWRAYKVPGQTAWIARQSPGFRAEVQTYVDANPDFLTKLVKP